MVQVRRKWGRMMVTSAHVEYESLSFKILKGQKALRTSDLLPLEMAFLYTFPSYGISYPYISFIPPHCPTVVLLLILPSGPDKVTFLLHYLMAWLGLNPLLGFLERTPSSLTSSWPGWYPTPSCTTCSIFTFTSKPSCFTNAC